MKKIFLLFLVFGLIFSLLTACGESKNTEDTDTPVSAVQESEPEVSSDPAESTGTATPSEQDQPSESENPSEPAESAGTEAPSGPDQPSESAGGDPGNAEEGEYSFIGIVEDVSEHEIMIEATEGDIQNYGDSVLVSFPDEIDLDVQIGDTVRVTFDGIVMPSLPPRVSASSYEILESAG